MSKYNKAEVGERIRKQRIMLGLTQEEFAARIERACKYCQDIERGSCGMSVDTMLSIASSLNISLDYLIHGDDDSEVKLAALSSEQLAVLNILGQCSSRKKRYALDLLKLFVKACDDK